MGFTFSYPADMLAKQDHFTTREVGLSHPDVSSFMRLRDNGDIEIATGDGTAIILSRSTSTITLKADRIRFITDAGEGLLWNTLHFNSQATVYNEPTFFNHPETDMRDLYKGAQQFYATDPNDPDKHTDIDKVSS